MGFIAFLFMMYLGPAIIVICLAISGAWAITNRKRLHGRVAENAIYKNPRRLAGGSIAIVLTVGVLLVMFDTSGFGG